MKGSYYLFDDEAAALEERAELERTSQAEIIRRALRQYLGLSRHTQGTGAPIPPKKTQ